MLDDVLRRIGVVALVTAILGGLWLIAAIKANPMIIGPSYLPRSLMELKVPNPPSLRFSYAEADAAPVPTT